MNILLDSGAWYAIADASDRYHKEASPFTNRTRMPLLTMETGDLEAAWQIIQTFSDQDFSFVDCTTFTLMERLAIDDAFAFETHFLVYRFGPGRRRAFRRHPR